jgi:RNA polymerase sigma factor (sigma-70 family)
MAELIRVDWSPNSSFVLLISELTALASRRWGGEPTEALGEVWRGLNKTLEIGAFIDRKDRMLRTIIRRRVSNFFRRGDRPPSSQTGRIPLEAVGELMSSLRHVSACAPRADRRRGHLGESMISMRQLSSPDNEVANRELGVAIGAAISQLRPRRREVALALWLKDTANLRELASRLGTSRQNIEKHAKKALEELQGSLSRFS